MPFLFALGVSVLLAGAAWGARTLTSGGAAAAAVIAAAMLTAAGWEGALVLGTFFIPSTLVGRLGRGRPNASDAKGERRDAVQVSANGLAAAVGALLEPVAPGLGLWVFTCSLAAAAADTWATSSGVLSRSNPRHLISGRPVPPGTSGGVSVVGTVGAVAGGLSVSLAGFAVGGGSALLVTGTAIGFVGMLLDSLLGATVQRRCICPVCGTPSERRRHHCGSVTQGVGGWRWLDNDGVNALATGFAAVAGGFMWRWLS
jgi:uncharacterized protein (TIGR00297 family)